MESEGGSSRGGERVTRSPTRWRDDRIEFARRPCYSANLQTREDVKQLTKNDAGRTDAITNEIATTPSPFIDVLLRFEGKVC